MLWVLIGSAHAFSVDRVHVTYGGKKPKEVVIGGTPTEFEWENYRFRLTADGTLDDTIVIKTEVTVKGSSQTRQAVANLQKREGAEALVRVEGAKGKTPLVLEFSLPPSAPDKK
ncbi:hypothetical protein K2X33_08335 [bacterium]|nr:hypothetical protein [bacterium]